ncbi:membrane protein insertion efficiency factor YidD [Flavivirga aquatica]|uniref:membrane protein insertion efficiency factor YidD n=1 Tax=Flavivirga aquatica TaxID=1849968 RepID=UPI0009F5E095|nr:membrane protein insertion efficiency factor YidD [Flavivirga aquatica]
MKHLLIIIIKLYWKFIPESKRRKCLFKKSCSNYVYEVTESKGLLHGLKALKIRINNCHPNYNLIEVHGEKLLITNSNNIFKQSEISETILN